MAIITLRLVVWPGFGWALGWDYVTQTYTIAYYEVAFAYLATAALLTAAWTVASEHSIKTALVLESACWTILGIFLAVSLIRFAPRSEAGAHWVAGLMATIWLSLVLNQLYRMKAGGRLMMIVRAVFDAL